MGKLLFYQILERLGSFFEKKERLQLVGLSLAARQLLVAHLIEKSFKTNHGRKLLFLCSSSKELQEWASFITSLPSLREAKESLYKLPFLPYWDLLKQKDHEALRFQSLGAQQALFGREGPFLGLTTPSALLQKVFHKDSFDQKAFSLKENDSIDMDDLEGRLSSLGFKEAAFVYEKGFFARRGGVFDVFSISSEFPTRLEFFGDTLSSIRSFDPLSQKTLDKLQNLHLGPCFSAQYSDEERKELLQKFFSFLTKKSFDERHKLSLMKKLEMSPYLFEFEALLPHLGGRFSCAFDHLDESVQVVLLGSFSDMIRELHQTKEDLALVFEALMEYPEILGDPKEYFFEQSYLERLSQRNLLLSFSNLEGEESFSSLVASEFVSPQKTLFEKKGKVEEKFAELESLVHSFSDVVLFFEEEDDLLRMARFLEAKTLFYEVNSSLLSNLQGFLSQEKAGKFQLSLGRFSGGFYDELREVFFCDGTLLLDQKRTKKRKSKKALFLHDELSSGDYVIHETHGVGQFEGLQELDLHQGFFEFLKLVYKNNDILYLPIDNLDRVSKYQKSERGSSKISLDKLGGKSWSSRKRKVEENIRELAKKLLETEALRKLAQSKGFSEPESFYFDFCSDFPFQETDDQARAIEEVEADLCAPFYMDRLLVGDVGFGKTEVAMRAAMLTVLQGQQVLFFVPTTILCEQHYLRFVSRFSKYGVRLGILNRFQKKGSKEALDSFLKGEIDILIGTHALLSLKVEHGKVGLIILDEEHKLGVKHKKHFRDFAGHTNVLTMTATPLPRTLNMAISGLRHISLIQEAPPGRLSVKTFFSEKNDRVIRNAISFELNRDGQVIYLHNTIENFPEIERSLKEIYPDLVITKAHGRMRPGELSSSMRAFSEGGAQLLLATTIVESGVDLPNVNTLIVSDCERYGLSQLHQIRGRVGRSTNQSYAYFFYHRKAGLTEAAKSRMEAMLSYESLGAGFHLASADMVLRGVGNLLGAEQSGDVLSVGVDLYLQMLEEAVGLMKEGKLPDSRMRPEIKLKQRVGLPKSYIVKEKDRLSLYNDILKAETVDELDEALSSLQDLYGAAPVEVHTLFTLGKVKLKMVKLGAVKLQDLGGGQGFSLDFLLSSKEASLVSNFLKSRSLPFLRKAEGFLKVQLLASEGLIDILSFLQELESLLMGVPKG